MPTSSTATSSTGRRGAAPHRPGRRRAGLCAAGAAQPAQGRGRARREPARRAAGERAGARHRGRRLRAARQAPRPARDRGGEPRHRRARRGPRMAALEVQPGHAGSAAHRDRHLGRPGAVRGARGSAGGGDGLQARRSPTAARCSSASAWARWCAAARARWPETCRWPGSPLSPDTAKMTGQFQVAIDAGQFLKAEPGRGPAARRAQPAVAAAAAAARLPRPVRGRLRVRQRHRRPQASGNGVATTNNLRMRGACGGGADGRRGRHRARDAEPARRRRARDQRRHRVAGLCGHQPGDRPRHLPGAVLPAQAARRGGHPRVPRHRALGRSEGRARRAHEFGDVARGRGAGCGRRRRAAEDDDAARTRSPIEDRRPADGLDAERRAQPRRRPRAAGAQAAREGAELPSCRSTSASWAAATATSSRVPKRPATDRSRRCSPRRRASTGSGSSAARLPLRSGERRPGAECATCVFSPDGERVARYDKIHLFRYDNGREQYDEGRTLKAGSDAGRVRGGGPARRA